MGVLIVENEIYLAQSINDKLNDAGYDCNIALNLDQINHNKSYEVILLSTNINNFIEVIKKYENSIIILMISYFSIDTVVTPIQKGAMDYIQKPFMVEELIRKIKHYQHYKQTKLLNNAYFAYIKSKFKNIQMPCLDYKKIKLPLILKTNQQSNADAFVFHYINIHKLDFVCFDLGDKDIQNKIKFDDKNALYFLINIISLKNEDQMRLLEFAKNKNIIIHCKKEIKQDILPVISLNEDEKKLDDNEILTINEYVKFIISNYQNIYSDTDLAKKLGISRKSLWERRKRYALQRKK